jgi:hypothetical protein
MGGHDSWQLLFLKTGIDKGFINNSDFVLQENFTGDVHEGHRTMLMTQQYLSYPKSGIVLL